MFVCKPIQYYNNQVMPEYLLESKKFGNDRRVAVSGRFSMPCLSRDPSMPWDRATVACLMKILSSAVD